MLQQLWQQGLVPELDAPRSKSAGDAEQIALEAPRGKIYYTTDGSDPRQAGGTVASTALAYSAPLPTSARSKIKARVFHRGDWSSLTEH